MTWPDYLTTWEWCGNDDPHPTHWFRGFNGVDHNTTDIKCRGRDEPINPPSTDGVTG